MTHGLKKKMGQDSWPAVTPRAKERGDTAGLTTPGHKRSFTEHSGKRPRIPCNSFHPLEGIQRLVT